MSTKTVHKIVSLFVGIVLLLGMVGCAAPTAAPTAAPEQKPTEAANPPATEAAPAKEPVTLTYWYYYTDRSALFEEYGKEYEALTGVKIKFELIPGDTLGQKFTAAAEAGTLPDICSAWVGIGEGTAPYAKEGVILNLKSYMDAGWGKQFVPALLDAASFAAGNEFDVEPGPYLIPLDANNMQFLYNKKLFEQAGITETPKTFQEFLDVGTKLKAIGVAPFVSGFGSWGAAVFATPYYWNIIGADDLEKTYAGEMKYSTQPWIDFLTLFEKMAKSDVVGTGLVSYDFPAAESLFVNGQAGMIFDGSWAIGVFNSQNPDFKDYGVFFPPAVEGAKYPVYIPGGVGAMEFVVGTSPNKEEAIKFMQWMTAAEQQAKYATSSFNLPANINVAGKVPMTESLTAFASTMDKTPPKLVHGMKSAVETTMIAGIQRILSGQDTPQHVAELMQLAHETDKAQ
jgi:ABC-type glycerol-3-phosphate transport system substrate-binding protein